LNFDTPIIIVDSAKASSKQSVSSRKDHDYPLKEFPTALFYNLHDFERVDSSILNTRYRDEEEDLLSDEYFESIHKRPERQEKGIRNNDKGRAQHEKDQVIRLLEGLQGPDWLRIMGVSGVTDSKKKEFEPARHHFVKGCHAIIEKFRIWRDEEKRRKLEKEQAMAEAEAEEEEADIEEDVAERRRKKERREAIPVMEIRQIIAMWMHRQLDSFMKKRLPDQRLNPRSGQRSELGTSR